MSQTALSPRTVSSARSPWTLSRVPETYVIANVRAVLPDRVTDTASLVVQDGRIAEIKEGPSAVPGDVDGGGLLLIPGLIDVHSDALEKERTPRPSAELPLDFALSSFESKIVAAGITTMFHGAGFHAKISDGVRREPARALRLCEAVDQHHSSRVDHRILHRFNVRGTGADLIRERLAGLPQGHEPIMLSHEDHTPGQGQYADVEHFIDALVSGGEKREVVEARVAQQLEKARETDHIRVQNLGWAGELASAGRARLLGHDPDSATEIDALIARGGSIAEFPTTLEAALRARERGLVIVAGAPNVLRGGSHSGNIGATELIRQGLVDALASDYLPTGLLGAVATLVRDGVVELPAAIRLVTEGGARAAGLEDRGRIAPGLLADLVLVDWSGTWPHVVTTFKSAGGRLQ